MLAPPETRAFFCSSTLCARMWAEPKALPLWSAELKTKRLDQLERLDSGLRACAADGGQRRSRRYIVPDIKKTPDIGSTRYWYIAILHTHLEQHQGFFGPYIRTLRYFLQYRDHKGHDIGEKPDIGFGKERVCPHIDPTP